MMNELPYRELLRMKMEDGEITYTKVNQNDILDAYIISFPDTDVASLSTLIDCGKKGEELQTEIIEALCNSPQGQSFVEISYLTEHFALADCRDYSVEEDISAYLVFVKLSENTEFYGAIEKGYSLAEVSKLIAKKKIGVSISDREALDRVRSLEKNIMQDRIRSIYV